MLKQDVPSSPRAYELFLRANQMSRDSRHWQASLDLYQQCVKEIRTTRQHWLESDAWSA